VYLVSFIFQRLTHPIPLFTDLGRRGEVWKICIFSYKCPFVEHQSSVIFLTEVRVSLCQREAESLNPFITRSKPPSAWKTQRKVCLLIQTCTFLCLLLCKSAESAVERCKGPSHLWPLRSADFINILYHQLQVRQTDTDTQKPNAHHLRSCIIH